MQESLFDDSQSIGEELGDLESWCEGQGLQWIVGIDEAGRGPLAGPVYAAAVAVDVTQLEASWIDRLDDSKKLTEEAREAAFDEILGSAPAFGVAERSPQVIDEVNVLQATRQAMAEASEAACEKLTEAPDFLVVDGNVTIETARRQRTLVRGDARSYAVAAASILAKVSRDRVMVEYDEQWPVYNFASNKGYPTKEHRRALRESGPCPIHRRSFGGVAGPDEG